MFAVIKTGGKQYKVAEGDVIQVEKLPGEAAAKVELAEVLMLSDGATVTVGKPIVAFKIGDHYQLGNFLWRGN